VNLSGITLKSDISNAAPVIDKSRIVQAILSPPYSIWAGFLTRQRAAARVSTMRWQYSDNLNVSETKGWVA
jgi:hypothetical protein